MEGMWFGGRGLAVVVELQGVDMVRGRRAWWLKFPVQIGERWSTCKEASMWQERVVQGFWRGVRVEVLMVNLVVDVGGMGTVGVALRYKTGKVAGELFVSWPRLLQPLEVAPGRGAQTVLLVLNNISDQHLLLP